MQCFKTTFYISCSPSTLNTTKTDQSPFLNNVFELFLEYSFIYFSEAEVTFFVVVVVKVLWIYNILLVSGVHNSHSIFLYVAK